MHGNAFAAGLRCDLVPPDAVGVLGGNILGIVEYADRATGPVPCSAGPRMAMAMTGGGDRGFVEVWRSTGEVTTGQYGDLVYAHDGTYLFCCGQTGSSADYLGPSERVYLEVLELMSKLDYPQPIRMWNMVEGINELAATGECHYRRFCQGRGAAFEQGRIGTTRLPAATGVGSHAGGVACYLLAGRSVELTHLENPRQTPAYRYPRQYGATSPSFARATYLAPDRPGAAGWLFISGTASIIGSATVHQGDVEAQCATTLENIAELVAADNLVQYGIDADLTLRDVERVKVYVKPGADLSAVRRVCEPAFAARAGIGYARVDICRDDLLVEIEGVARVN